MCCSLRNVCAQVHVAKRFKSELVKHQKNAVIQQVEITTTTKVGFTESVMITLMLFYIRFCKSPPPPPKKNNNNLCLHTKGKRVFKSFCLCILFMNYPVPWKRKACLPMTYWGKRLSFLGQRNTDWELIWSWRLKMTWNWQNINIIFH